VELNVIEQCLNVFKTGVVQRARHASRTKLREDIALTGLKSRVNEDAVFPRVHGMVFNPSEGILKKLPVNFDQRLGSLDHIYGLYETRRPKAKAVEAEMADKA
jgi:carbonic anhydrase